MASFLELGSPEDSVAALAGWGPPRRDSHARAYAERLLPEALAFVRSGGGHVGGAPLASDDKRERLRAALSLISRSPSGYAAAAAPGADAENFIAAQSVAAKWITSSRLALPSIAGKVDPSPYLCPERRAVFRDLQRLKRPFDEWEHAPRPCHRMHWREELKLYGRLLECRMGALVPLPMIPRTPSGRLLTSGAFAVYKSADEDRLIIDRRPQSATEGRLHWLTLPSPNMQTVGCPTTL